MVDDVPRPEPAGAIVVCGNLEAARLYVGVITHHPVIHTLDKRGFAVDSHLSRQRIALEAARIVARNGYQVIIRFFNRTVGIQVDSRIENQAAVHVAIWRDIASTACKSKPEGGFAAYNHDMGFYKINVLRLFYTVSYYRKHTDCHHSIRKYNENI